MAIIGETVERQVIFRDLDGNLADPVVVNANAKKPNGTSVVGSVRRQSLGVWDGLFTADLAGLWFFRIEGEGGSVNAVVEGSFCVQRSSVE